MTTFSSTVDEELARHIAEASELAGVKKAKPKATGPKTFDCPEGFRPIMSVIPMPKVSHNIPVRVFKIEDWPEAVRMFIPEKDLHYVFPPDATVKVCGKLFSTRPRKEVGPFLLTGPTGSGKTTLFQQICAYLCIPFIRVNCRIDMESAALFGGFKYNPVDGLVWQDGPMPEIARAGGFFCLDEGSRIPTGIMDSLQYVLEEGGKVYLADKPGDSRDKFIEPHEWFRLGITDNTELQGDTTGKYVSANVQDEAMINRITGSYRLGYLEPAHEIAIIMGKVKEVDNLTAQKMVQMARLIRDAYDKGNLGLTMSPRTLLSWANDIAYWGSEREAFKLSFFNKLTQTDQAVVAEFYHTVFAENLR